VILNLQEKETDTETFDGMMELITSVIGKMTRPMEKEESSIIMETFMRVNGKTIKQMVKANIRKQEGRNLSELGRMICNMVNQ
jgi:hypothetical protein